MGHIIACYPNFELSLSAALGIAESGASYLEVQFPFSDPNADGIIIEAANHASIANGFKVAQGFELVSALDSTFKAHKLPTKLIIMTYANIIYSYGIKAFVKMAKHSGAWGIIAPDLPIECDEHLRHYARLYHLNVISLIAPNTDTKRIKKIAKVSNEIIYVVARAGTTGAKTHISKDLLIWLDAIKTLCEKPIALGFGINDNAQVRALQSRVDIIVAGSYFVKKISELALDSSNAKETYTTALKAHAKKLMGF